MPFNIDPSRLEGLNEAMDSADPNIIIGYRDWADLLCPNKWYLQEENQHLFMVRSIRQPLPPPPPPPSPPPQSDVRQRDDSDDSGNEDSTGVKEERVCCLKCDFAIVGELDGGENPGGKTEESLFEV